MVDRYKDQQKYKLLLTKRNLVHINLINADIEMRNIGVMSVRNTKQLKNGSVENNGSFFKCLREGQNTMNCKRNYCSEVNLHHRNEFMSQNNQLVSSCVHL